MQTKHIKVHTEDIVQVMYCINFFAAHLAFDTIINQHLNRQMYVHMYNINMWTAIHKTASIITFEVLSYTAYYKNVAAIFCWWK